MRRHDTHYQQLSRDQELQGSRSRHNFLGIRESGNEYRNLIRKVKIKLEIEERFDHLARSKRALGTSFYPRESLMIPGCESGSVLILQPTPSYSPTPMVGSWIREITETES
jgi:hypothetical protein